VTPGKTVQTRLLDGGNNAGITMVTTSIQHEGKEVSTIRTTRLVQQGQQCLCNIGNGASATRATMSL
jgi:hypothetical protein